MDRGILLSGTHAPASGALLFGRAHEQEVLRKAWAGARAGRGQLVLLGGEAGIGKTTLTRDLAATAQGDVVLAGHCFDLTNTPPYGPWLDLFDGYRTGDNLPHPPAAFAGGQLAFITDRAALFAEVRRFFAELSAVRPVLVLLEDLHWADPASLDLLRHIGPALHRWPILVLATYRSDELTRLQPFAQLFPALVREADGQRLDLPRLAAGAFHDLVSARYRLAAADETRLVAYLECHADGNPFFAVELLRTLQEGGLLRAGENRSSLGELARVLVPHLLRQVIDGRIDRLGEQTRRPLEIAAVIGQEVPLDLWTKLADIDEETLLGIVEQAVDAHLLEAERDGTHVRFVHALTREALYEGVLPPRRRLWHGRVAEALAAKTDADPDAVAYHLQQAGDPQAWEWLEQAGERAQRAYAWLTAIDRFRTAAALLDGMAGHEATRGRLLYRLVRLQRYSDPDKAIATHEEVERLVAEIGDCVLAADARYYRGVLLCYADRFRTGLTEMRTGVAALAALPLEATQVFTTSSAWLADALPATTAVDATGDDLAAALLHAAGLHYRSGVLPWFLASAGQPLTAFAAAEQFIAVLADVPGTRVGIRSTAGFSYHGLGIACAALGRFDEAHEAFAQTRKILAELDHHAVIAFSLLNELRDVALTHDAAKPAVRRRLAAEAEAALGRAGGALRPGLSPRLAWLGCLVLDGRWAEADQILRDLPNPGNTYLRREVTSTIAVIAYHRGELDAAWTQTHSLLPDGPATEPGDVIHQEGLLLQRLAVDLCLDAADLTTARIWLEAHDRWLAWSGSVLGQAEGGLAWARWHRNAGELEQARTRAFAALERAAQTSQPLVAVGVHRLLGEIATTDRQYGAAEAHLLASLGLADACEAPFERASTLLALARLRLAADSIETVDALLQEVRDICTRLGAAPTLAQADRLTARPVVARPVVSPPCGLSRREAEVLCLLARHHTDKEIADTLFISSYTASTHVKHVLAKLGVANRREAAAHANRHGLC